MAAAETELQMVLLNAGKGRECEHITIYMPKWRARQKRKRNGKRDTRREETFNMRQVKGQMWIWQFAENLQRSNMQLIAQEQEWQTSGGGGEIREGGVWEEGTVARSSLYAHNELN